MSGLVCHHRPVGRTETGQGLGAFVPADVRLAVARGVVLPDRADGAVLEADLTSFIALTDSLAHRLGPRRGAEEVAALLTRVYGALSAELDRFAGSLVEFTGDAISCCFHDDDGIRAIHCGLGMQAAMAALRTDVADSPTDSPTVRVTVATGPFRRFSVGDPQIRVLEVLAGPAVDRLVALAPFSRPGEVLVDGDTVRRLGDRIQLAGSVGGAPDPPAVVAVRGPPPPPAGPIPAILDDVARRWLPAAVHARLAEGDEHLLSDLRSVVALFAGFGAIDYAADNAGPRLDAYTRFAQRTLDHYGGTLFTVAVDAKGSYVCAGFGAPAAHDDDPQRAAAAALALREPPASAGAVAGGGIGITQGRLYAGMYGGGTRRTFGLHGATMNLAARLMQAAAPGQILVEERLARPLADRHVLRPLTPQVVKGRPAPVEASELIGPRQPSAAAAAAPHLVDRRGERAALEAHLDRLRDRTGGVLLLEGEPGIGKSRLVRHLTDRAAAAGFAVHAGAGDPIERGAPYHGWRPVFAGALGLDPLADGAVTPGLSGDARAEATRDLLAATLDALAHRTPTVIAIDDAHWLDSASLALVLRLAVAPGPLLLVIASRPLAESGRVELDRLVALPDCHHLRIGPLPLAEAVELAGRAIGAAASPPLVALIEAKAGGNPLFSRELAYALRDGGLQARPDADGPAVESPDRVETVIASRVDRLAGPAQTLLKVGSVLGLSFAEDALVALAGQRPLDHRHRLEELQLLAPAAGPAGAPTLAFRHALVRDVVYSRLLYAQRRALHRQAAEYYERTAAAGSTPAALAHHWEQAGLPARAVEHLAAAGHAALHAGAFQECRDAYARALELTAAHPASTDPRRAEWTWHTAHACYRLGEIDASRDFGAQAIAALDRPVPAGGPARVAAAAVGELARQALHRLLPRWFPDRAAPADQPALRFAVEALVMMAEVYYVGADNARSSYVALRALNVAERLDPCPELARAYGAMCIIAGIVGAHRLAERYADLSRRTSLALDDAECVAHTLQQVCMYRSSVGPYDGFAALYASAVAGYRHLGNRPRLRDTAGMAGIADHLFGRPDQADRRLRELLDAVEPQEATLGAAWSHLWLGIAALRRGRPDETLGHLRAADDLRDRQAVDVISVNVHAINALALRRSGRDADARDAEAAAWELVGRLGRRPASHIVLDGYAALAELALAAWDGGPTLGDRLRARRRAREACRNLRVYARTFPIGAPAHRLYAAERARRLGRRDQARRGWSRAVAAATRLDMRWELALAHAALADHLPDGPDRAGHRHHASRLLAELGAPPGTRAVTPPPARPTA